VRAIRKVGEPDSLTRHRLAASADYENYAGKDDLRAALVAEQRGVFCYCLSRIGATSSAMKIEHWHCRDNYSAEQLKYSNLLGACLGNHGQPPKSQHCDTRKGNSDLSRNRANPAHRVEDLVRFPPGGKIESDDPDFNREIDDILNLNVAFLKNNRKATLDGFIGGITKRGRWTRATLQNSLREWNGESHSDALRPFCQVVVYWLRKRLARD
jgi:uncharacterized protein (TIGR02646 family)